MWPAEIRILPGRPRRARVTKAAPKRTQALAGWAEVIAIQRWRLTGPRAGPAAIAGASRSLGPTHGYAVSNAEGILFAPQGGTHNVSTPFVVIRAHRRCRNHRRSGLAAFRPPVALPPAPIRIRARRVT